ncbi:MAG: hypothetical protein GWP19_00790 [Planctomycetia bacterium]|nr:hypothetical protein [Planctomycetia bacterium]
MTKKNGNDIYDNYSAMFYEKRDKKLISEKKSALKHAESCSKSRRKRKKKRK